MNIRTVSVNKIWQIVRKCHTKSGAPFDTTTSSMTRDELGLRRLGERITMASDVFSFVTGPLSQSHVFTSCMQAYMRATPCMWSFGGKVTYN